MGQFLPLCCCCRCLLALNLGCGTHPGVCHVAVLEDNPSATATETGMSKITVSNFEPESCLQGAEQGRFFRCSGQFMHPVLPGKAPGLGACSWADPAAMVILLLSCLAWLVYICS